MQRPIQNYAIVSQQLCIQYTELGLTQTSAMVPPLSRQPKGGHLKSSGDFE